MDELHKDEVWTRWNPENIPECHAYSVDIRHEESGIVFLVEFDDKIIKVSFDGNIPMYVYSDEGLRMATYAPVQKKHNDNFYFRDWFLYRVENSDFLKWTALESLGIYGDLYNKHFCIVTENDVVDILSAADPTFEIIPNSAD